MAGQPQARNPWHREPHGGVDEAPSTLSMCLRLTCGCTLELGHSFLGGPDVLDSVFKGFPFYVADKLAAHTCSEAQS